MITYFTNGKTIEGKPVYGKEADQLIQIKVSEFIINQMKVCLHDITNTKRNKSILGLTGAKPAELEKLYILYKLHEELVSPFMVAGAAQEATELLSKAFDARKNSSGVLSRIEKFEEEGGLRNAESIDSDVTCSIVRGVLSTSLDAAFATMSSDSVYNYIAEYARVILTYTTDFATAAVQDAYNAEYALSSSRLQPTVEGIMYDPELSWLVMVRYVLKHVFSHCADRYFRRFPELTESPMLGLQQMFLAQTMDLGFVKLPYAGEPVVERRAIRKRLQATREVLESDENALLWVRRTYATVYAYQTTIASVIRLMRNRLIQKCEVHNVCIHVAQTLPGVYGARYVTDAWGTTVYEAVSDKVYNFISRECVKERVSPQMYAWILREVANNLPKSMDEFCIPEFAEGFDLRGDSPYWRFCSALWSIMIAIMRSRALVEHFSQCKASGRPVDWRSVWLQVRAQQAILAKESTASDGSCRVLAAQSSTEHNAVLRDVEQSRKVLMGMTKEELLADLATPCVGVRDASKKEIREPLVGDILVVPKFPSPPGHDPERRDFYVADRLSQVRESLEKQSSASPSVESPDAAVSKVPETDYGQHLEVKVAQELEGLLQVGDQGDEIEEVDEREPYSQDDLQELCDILTSFLESPEAFRPLAAALAQMCQDRLKQLRESRKAAYPEAYGTVVHVSRAPAAHTGPAGQPRKVATDEGTEQQQ